ncbi:MAG TPA: tRNA (adenosine(37)-N6)-threonylcarbamoyltransferase complex transferase subunit TsaD [Candidatus Babeliales bacterium]|nr:tRNA (adenosine(37)-N6)-threonylcarbamoyltransferase complex transferase subunit TsaD [Candidatus Babeliales bacterium]
MAGRLILGIETSCDETAAAVYSSDDGLRSNVLYSQTEIHKEYGGVIPELASRSHLEKINSIVHRALEHGGVTLDAIDAIAVTVKPGLPGSLLVGLSFAKAIAWAKKKPIIGIDHLEGHIFSSFLEKTLPFPYLCLSASGGHTALYIVKNFGEFQIIGQTLDDAAGEAFDKIAKLMGLGYPGGPLIEKYAQEISFQDFFHYPSGNPHTLDFSFSGLKTAVLYDLVKRGWYDLQSKSLLATMSSGNKKQVASSLLVCINKMFEQKIELALKEFSYVRGISFVGGVACNRFIKGQLAQLAIKHSVPFASPSPAFCTDNAAMIAFVGNYKAEQNKFDTYSLDIF